MKMERPMRLALLTGRLAVFIFDDGDVGERLVQNRTRKFLKCGLRDDSILPTAEITAGEDLPR